MSVRKVVWLGMRFLGAILVCASATGLVRAQCHHGGGSHSGGPPMMGGGVDPRVLQALVMQNMLQQRQLMQQVQQQVMQKKVLDDLAKEVAGKGPDEIKKALTDSRPEMRWIAALVVGEKGLVSLSREMMDLLTDTNPYVRQAARRGLVSLSKIAQKSTGELKSTVRNPRGVDFGPLPESNRAAQKIAVRKWGEWFDRRAEKLADVTAAKVDGSVAKDKNAARLDKKVARASSDR